MMRRSLYLMALFALAGVHAAPAPEPNPQPDPADDKPEIIEIIAPAASAQETLATLNLGAPGSELSERNKRTIGILRQLFPSLTQNSIAEENLLSGAESQQAEVRVAFGESGSGPGAAGADQQGAASEDQQTAAQTNSASIDEITLDDADGSEENRNKRFLSFGGAGGASGGGSGNFLFDIVRRPAEAMARAAGSAFRLFAGTDSLNVGLTASHTATLDPNDPQLVAGSPSGASGGEAAAEGDDGSAAKGDNLTEGVPGPITRLFIIANRGIANLIQDLILRIAQTSERIVNFKARLITSII
uniref:Uncharacterized protein n=1 Tax=Bombyx mori TaxID=7091 RepID=A0A8R2QZ12_BOMMO|nr:uncharacterized protein LOC101736716 isoform X3 [Bombyx mori]XP_037867938.1 uncharacterized protein LOC101736716 isoform X3 [Bombyx mori]